MCVMRNLSYQLYAELPPSVRLHLEGPSRASASKDSNTIGCFTLHTKKNNEVTSDGRSERRVWMVGCVHTWTLSVSTFQQQRYQNLHTLAQPKGAEWLWHPKVVSLYKLVLQNSTGSLTTREAALGALQNITVGEARVSSPVNTVDFLNSQLDFI